jgi:hypothetical protein
VQSAESLATDYILQCVRFAFGQVRRGASVGFEDVELALHMMFLYGEALKGLSPVCFLPFFLSPLEISLS